MKGTYAFARAEDAEREEDLPDVRLRRLLDVDEDDGLGLTVPRERLLDGPFERAHAVLATVDAHRHQPRRARRRLFQIPAILLVPAHRYGRSPTFCSELRR